MGKKIAIILCILALNFCVSAQDSTLVFRQLTSMPTATPKEGSSFFVIDSSFFVVGGKDSEGYYSNEVWKYEVSANSWTRMNDFPGGAIFTAGAFAINKKGYICGGQAQNTAIYHSVWEYTPSTDSWIRKNDYLGPSVQVQSCFSFGSKGYLGLGFGGSSNDLSEYDPTIDQWTVLDTLPAPGRYGCATVVSDSFAYFFGGYYRYIYGHSCKEVWRFNLISSYWEQMQDMPGTERSYSATWLVGNNIVCGLGIYFDSIREFQTDKYVYNTLSKIWKPINFQGFLDSVSYGYSFIIGNTGYYFGGARRVNPDFSYRTEMWSFDATPLLPTGIANAIEDVKLNVFPNPLSDNSKLTISSPEEGVINFTNSIGQLLYTSAIHAGENVIPEEQFHASAGIIFYSAQLRHGTANGRVVIVK